MDEDLAVDGVGVDGLDYVGGNGRGFDGGFFENVDELVFAEGLQKFLYAVSLGVLVIVF